jgi:hypothetical protein
LVIGLPFSDKKIIPQDTEQDGTDGSSVGISPVSQKKKPQNSVPNHFSKEKNPQNAVPNHFWMRKTLGILFRTIFGREKPRKSVPNHFRKRKNLGIPFRIIFRREKTSEKTAFVSCFVNLHYFVEFRSVPFCSELRNGLFRNTWNHMESALYSAE